MNISIPKEDLETAEKYIRSYAFTFGSQSLIEPMEKILAPWDEAKSLYLYKLLDNNLILSKETALYQDPEEVRYAMRDLASSSIHDLFKFRSEWYHKVSNCLGENYRSRLNALITDSYWLSKNIYYGEDMNIPLPNGKTYELTTGTKLVRAIGKIAKAYDVSGFEQFRIAHSQILNQKTLQGKLCLSIHPLDYMTMSDNDSGWESCMSWIEEGSYRCGTVEMMNSPMVVVAYLDSSVPFRINGTPWSNKKWRELYIVTPQLITNVRGYPYDNPELTQICLDWIKSLAETNLGWKYHDEISVFKIDTNYNTYYPIGDAKAYVRFTTNYMYNDTTEGMKAYITTTPIEEWEEMPHTYQSRFTNLFTLKSQSFQINYSGASECMCCGSIEDNFCSEKILVCQDCEPIAYCADCEEYFREEDGEYIDGEFYCHDCAERHKEEMKYHGCDYCGCDTDEDINISLYLDDNKTYVASIMCCDNCLEEISMLLIGKRDWPNDFTYTTNGTSITNITWSQIKDIEGLKLFYERMWFPASFETWYDKYNDMNTPKRNKEIDFS